MRLGVLDIGSNSAHLQLVDVTSGAPPLPAHALKEPTVLGEEILPDGSLNDQGMRRVANAVLRAVRASHQFEVDHLYSFVTAAVRDATNRDEVLNRIEEVAGIRPQFLSGEQEARLTYLAAHRWYGWSAGRILLLDIGGGSMEIALGRDVRPELALSLPLGAGRLTRAFLTADPPTKAQLKELRKHIRAALSEVADRFRWEGDPRRVVATSKTFKQLARLAGAPPQRKGPFVPRALALEDVRTWIPKLAAVSAAQRSKLRGISASRARQIVAGAVVAKETMMALDIDSVEICPWALREGIVLRHLETMTEPGELPLVPLSRGGDATVTAMRRPPASHVADGGRSAH